MATVRKLKQILAGFLAMNLTIGTAPTGAINVRASEEYSSDSIYEETYAEEQSVQTYAEEVASSEQAVSETEAVAPISEDVVPAETPSSTENVDVSTSESTTETVSTIENISTTETVSSEENTSSTENTSATESTDNQDNQETIENSSSSSDAENTSASAEDESNKEELSSEEESSSEEDQTEETETDEENEVAKQTTDYVVTKDNLKLEQFKNYKETNGEKTITIESVQELILLSNCNQSQLQNVTINFNVVGNPDVTEKTKIVKDADLSKYLEILDTTAVTSNSEEQLEKESLENSTQEVQQNAEQTDDQDVEKQDDTQNDNTVQTGSIKAGEEYTFKGIGSADYPFNGKITGQNVGWTIDRPFFEGLSSNAVFYAGSDDVKLQLYWGGDGTKPMIAEVYQLDSPAATASDSSDASQKSLSVKVSLGTGATTMGSLIGTVKAASGCGNDILNIGNVCDYAGATVTTSSSSGNSGLICNVVQSGKIRISPDYSFPNTYTVNSTATYNKDDPSAAGNAGGVIGVMKTGTTLYINSANSASTTAIVESTNSNAGGLVGMMESDSQIVIETDVTLSGEKVTAGRSAGGVVGTAKNVTITGTGELNVKSPIVKGSTANSNAGGFIGTYMLSASDTSTEVNSYIIPSCLKLESPTASTTGKTDTDAYVGNSGGYFGYLKLEGNWTCTFGGESSTETKSFTSTHGDDSSQGRSYGAIAGKVTSNTIKSTVKVQNMNINSTYGNKATYHGGVIGELGVSEAINKDVSGASVYLEVSDVTVTVGNPYADGPKKGFGGLVGCLAQGSILSVQNTVTIGTKGTDPMIWEGGGIVGRAEKKSVIELSGITDLSSVNYVGNRSTVGWLVGYQDCALIYARGDGNGTGWTYKRGKATKQYNGNIQNIMNDIANYGQIIRLDTENNGTKSNLSYDLITINSDHTVTLKDAGDWSSNITLRSADDFALLSIAWNSRGYFSADSSDTIGSTTWDQLRSKKIILFDNIDLTASGVTGLSRDTVYYSNDNRKSYDTFEGVLDGNEKTLTLSIGDAFGYVENVAAGADTNGGGSVYAANAQWSQNGEDLRYHAAIGLFAKTESAEVKNLVLDGTINLSNRYETITAGGIAAVAEGTLIIDGVTVSVDIEADAGNNESKNLVVGGVYGDVSSGEITFQNNAKIFPTININNAGEKGAYIYAGGVIGQFAGTRFAANGLTVGDEREGSTGGKVTTDVTNYAYIGGLIGIIKPVNSDKTSNHWMEIRSLTFDNFTINAEKATEICGGLFGSLWANVSVYFMGEKDTDDGSYAGKTKLIVKNSTINAPMANGVGGLAYRSSGIWEVRDNGIDIQSLAITTAGDVGLLVCRGESSADVGNETVDKVTVEDKEYEFGALYLNVIKNWKNSYKLADTEAISITQTGTDSVFDEFVARTAIDASMITWNRQNGIISLATAESTDGRVGVDESDASACTTYQNRTRYGKDHKTNDCSRYYYDLDQCWSYLNDNRNEANDGIISTESELLLWSVYRYASGNIKHFFIDGKKANGNVDSNAFGDVKNVVTIGGNSANPKVKLDMRKYSYYPIDVRHDVTIQNATIKFYNQQIENAETENKSTQSATQHYTMHCGLFLSQLNNANIDTTVTVNNVTFSGSIGKVDGGSGVLFATSVSGSEKDGTLYIATVSLKDVYFDDLTVNNCGNNYAPLLINYIGSYSKLDADGVRVVKNSYEGGKTAASSLIGNVGASDAKQITLSFLNIVLPDKKVEEKGIFSHATLLESFIHDGSSSVATYNFYKGDEWNEDGTTYNHGVTYGYEITGSTEYRGKQLWYYDEDGYGHPENYVHTSLADAKSFSSESYLHYVYQPFNETSKAHEIKVNQRVTDITSGCGTYSHPYRITTEQEMTILSEYMATGTPRSDWRVKITGNQNSLHVGSETDYSSDQDKIYQFNGEKWVWVEKGTDGKWQSKKNSTGEEVTLEKDFMLQYLLNAYYDLRGTESEQDGKKVCQLELTNFGGFGIATRPFRGVITSGNGTTVVLKGVSTSNGLIPYSYGSVVKDITISYQKNDGSGKTLTYNGTKTSDYYPDVCFGGVIGCILGGDNIIDNVTVEIAENWLTIEGEKAYLIQVGGYVGSICGGGVIFRNMTDQNGLTNGVTGVSANTELSYAYMYVNPYVGRVLDGFAFYEKKVENAADKLENTDKNYEIQKLTANTEKEKSVTAEGDVVTVNGAQGLLILSAIVNSGAASNGVNNAYSNTSNKKFETSDKSTKYSFAGKYGKARNAVYDAIGKTPSETEENLLFADDQTAPGETSLPYLIKSYCDASTQVLRLSSGANIQLKSGSSYDMTSYGGGYQGISARYVSSAILREDRNNAAGVVPKIVLFNGNDNTVKLDVQVREYYSDDFTAVSVGGIVNLLHVDSSTTGSISHLTIEGSRKENSAFYSGVSIQYYSENGQPVTCGVDNENNAQKKVDVGAFAGAISGISADTNKTSGGVEFTSVTIQNLTVSGPQNAGGLLGSSKKVNQLEAKETGNALLLKSPNGAFSVGVTILNTKYNNITVTTPYAAGGFVGYIEGDRESLLAVTGTSEMIVGSEAKIGNLDYTSIYAGGAFGYVKSTIKVNLSDQTDVTYQNAKLQNVIVTASSYSGGFIGRIDQCVYQINKAVFAGEATSNSTTNSGVFVSDASKYAGGIVGWAQGSGDDCKIQNCITVQTVIKVQNTKLDSGVSAGDGGIVGRAENAKITIDGCSVQQVTITGGKVGGIVGNTAVNTNINNCKVLGTDEQTYGITGSETAGGIIGLSNASGAKIQMKQCKVSNMKMTSNSWGCGGMLGDVDWNAMLNTLYLFDCTVENSEVIGSVDGTTAGGFVGDIRGKLTASNLLLSGVTIHTKLENKVGIVIGMADSKTGGNGNQKSVSVAGLSIKKVTAYYGDNEEDTEKAVTQLYGVIADGTTAATEKDMKTYSYFAFADYFGAALTKDKKGDKDFEGNSVSEPYVVTSPIGSMSVYDSDDASENKLYGDGASWEKKTDGSFTLKAQEIWSERNSASNGRYAYSETGVTESFEISSKLSTYNTNNAEQTNKPVDFPVLQLTGGDTDAVTKYLDIVTNGGFSAANNTNTSDSIHVTATATMYEYNGSKFVKNADATTAFQVKTNSNKITFLTTTDYDNDQNRFTLLTVTFAETDMYNEIHKYSVFVPILVRRMLEMNFVATLTYGTDFNKLNYNEFSNHVLESFGSSITGYLTYVYNSDENGVYMDYGWQSYINAGGNLMEMKKFIKFVMPNKLPEGTQLTLVDEVSKKAYYYTATGDETYQGGGSVVPLGSFKDSSGELSYQEPSISELIGAVASDTGDNLLFVKVNEDGSPVGENSTEKDKEYPEPTIRIKTNSGYEYYRLADSTLGETGKYSITVDESNLKETKTVDSEQIDNSKVKENYYLVITVPAKSNSKELNGSIQTMIESKIPNKVHCRRRKENDTDGHVDTASTYQLSNGYQQALTQTSDDDISKKITTADSTMKINVTNKITFPNSQAYQAGIDQLYLRFVGGLQKTVKNADETTSTSAEQFPSGTTGTAKFFVYIEDNSGARTYYKYNADTKSWSQITDLTDKVAVSYTWTSDGGVMELPLATKQPQAQETTDFISLQEIRNNAKTGPTGNSNFYVELYLEATIPAAGLDVIPETQVKDGANPSEYTKLTCFSQLSTVPQSLSYSNNRALLNDMKTLYYRDVPAGATLTYEADTIDQLGINLLDLRYLDVAREKSIIDTTATYDLSSMKNLENVLKDSNCIKFTLTLCRKNIDSNTESYGSALSNADHYLSVRLKSGSSGTVPCDNGTWTWTVPKASYYDSNGIVENGDVFKGGKLTQLIELKVNVKDTDIDYSNYKVVLTAEILDSNDSRVDGSYKDNNIIYTFAKIKTEFVE